MSKSGGGDAWDASTPPITAAVWEEYRPVADNHSLCERG